MIHIIHKDVCIIGLGPASIGAALELSSNGLINKTIAFEIGSRLNEKDCKILNKKICQKENPCSIISGFGGSSVLGGSKLSYYPAGSKIAKILESDEETIKKFQNALQIFGKYVPLKEIKFNLSTIDLYKKKFEQKGFELKYYDVYNFEKNSLLFGFNNIESFLKERGLLIFYNTCVRAIKREGSIYKIFAENNEGQIIIYSKYVVVGTGRLGYELLENINTTFNLNAQENPVDIGVRLEFPTKIFPNIDKAHGDLKLLFQKNARTFCVCKGGKIAPYFLDDVFLTEGYLDLANPTEFTNIAILVRIGSVKYSDLMNVIKKQMILQTNGLPLRQTYEDYVHSIKTEQLDIPSSIHHYSWGEINTIFPPDISQKIKNAVTYFVSKTIQNDNFTHITLFAPEIHRNGYNFPLKKDFSVDDRIYLVGECSGAFRGILQSFTTGLICAESILERERA